MAETLWNYPLNQPAIGNELKSQWLQTIYGKRCTYFHGIESDLQVALVSGIVSVFDKLLLEGDRTEIQAATHKQANTWNMISCLINNKEDYF